MTMTARNLYALALKQVPKPQMKQKILFQKGLTKDIIQAIQQVFTESWKQTNLFSKNFQKQDLAQIHRFVVENIQYIIDPKGKQFIKNPSVTIYSKIGDCKAYSILIGSILQNLGIPFVFRFVKFTGDLEFSHVYIVTYKGVSKCDGQIVPDYILDACLPYPNLEKPYIEKLDVMPNTTQIIGVSGIGCSSNNYYSVAGVSGYENAEYFDEYEQGYDYYSNEIVYYNETPQIGFLKKIWGGIKNAATFVSDKIIKPIAKPLLDVASIAVDFLPIPGTSLIKKAITIAGKVLTVVDKSTGLVKAIDTGNPAGIVQAVTEINQVTQGKKFEAMTPEEKNLAIKRADLFAKGFKLAVDTGDTNALNQLAALQKQVEANAMTNPSTTNQTVTDTTNTNPQPKKSSNTGLFIGGAIALYFLTQGKGKRK